MTDLRWLGSGRGGDDAPALNWHLNSWLSRTRPRDLILPPEEYTLLSPLVLSPQGNTVGGRIIGHGATITAVGMDYALTVDTLTPGKIWRNLSIEGLTILGGGIRLRSGVGSASLYGWSVRDVAVEQFGKHGLFVDGAFEGKIDNARMEAAANPTGDCIHVTAGQGNASSIDVFGGSTRGGVRGLFSDSGDTDVFGGTYLTAREEGVRINNAFGTTVDGVHVENCWESATSQSAGRAGVKIVGRGVAKSVFGTTNSKMKYAVEFYTVGGCSLIGGLGLGLTAYGYVHGSGGSLTKIGVDQTVEVHPSYPGQVLTPAG